MREYLRRYIDKRFTVDIIGPSPFHANFFVECNATEFGLLVNKIKEGYDRINIRAKSSTISELAGEIFEQLGQEFNLFYLIMDLRSEQFKLASNVDQCAEMLIDGTKGLLSRYFHQYSYIQNTIYAIAKMEEHNVDKSSIIRTRMRDTYVNDAHFLKSYVENAIDDVWDLPLDSIKGLIEFHEKQSTLRSQSILTFSNTIIQVILGAAVAYLLYKAGVK